MFRTTKLFQNIPKDISKDKYRLRRTSGYDFLKIADHLYLRFSTITCVDFRNKNIMFMPDINQKSSLYIQFDEKYTEQIKATIELYRVVAEKSEQD